LILPILQLGIFFVIPFLVFILSSMGWWERPPRYLCLLVAIHGWWLGNITWGETSHEEHISTIRTPTLVFRKCLELIPNPTPHPLTQLHHTCTLAHVEEYIWSIHALTLNTLVAPLNKTTIILHLVQPLTKVDLPHFVDDFHPEIVVTLDWKAFIFALLVYHVFLSMTFQVWCMSFTRFFCPKWLCEWLQPFFKNMWAHCSRSRSTFSMTFVFLHLNF